MSAEARVEWRLPVAGAAEVRRATWLLIRADGRAMALVLLLNCLAAGTGLAAPWLLGRIVNAVSSGAPVSVVDSTVDRLALAVVGFAVAQPLLIRFARYAGNRFGERAACRLREDFVDRVLALPTSVVERAGTGDLTTRTSTDVAAVSATLRDAAPEVLLSTVQALFIYGAVFVLSPLLGLIAFAGLPVLVGVTRWYLKRARGAYLAAAAAASDLAESLAGTAEGARAVEAFGLGRRRVDVVDARADASRDARVRTLYLRSVLFPVADLSHALPISLMLFAGGTAYIHHLVSLGAVVAAALYMWQIVDPLDRVLALAEQVQSSGASMARISGVAEVSTDRPPAGDVLPADDRVEVVDVHFAYTPGHDVLAGVDLAVRPGERLAMVGPSGAGKSTLGRLLAGLDRPRSGRVTVGSVPVHELAPEELRRRILLVTQDQHVFLGTVRDNLALAAPAATDEDMYAALDAVGATWVAALPEGLDTELGPGRVRVDPPAAQQLALARVVLADPHTVVLDEATALLDPVTARATERSLAAALRGRTVIAIAHRLHTAHDADRVAVVDGGRLVELGSHDELLAAGGVYATLWRSWHGG